MTAVTIDHNTWVMVGDGEKALFFRNEGDAENPNLQMVDVLQHENPPTREQGTDRPGRSFSSVGVGSSALDNTNWHKLEKHRFAKEIADALYTAAHAGRYDKLIVVAPPMTLGDLRKAVHPEVSSRIVAEVDKTLTSMPAHRIEETLANLH
jgi:protein required for attachment to host cells